MKPTHQHNGSKFVSRNKRKIFLLTIVGFIVIGFGFYIYHSRASGNSSIDHTVKIPLEKALSQNDPQVKDGVHVETGLAAGEGLYVVIGSCTSCHSSSLILQNRYTREGWHERIVWMQETQGLWDLGENEKIILDYLASNYAPEEPRGRRQPLKDIQWYELKE